MTKSIKSINELNDYLISKFDEITVNEFYKKEGSNFNKLLSPYDLYGLAKIKNKSTFQIQSNLGGVKLKKIYFEIEKFFLSKPNYLNKVTTLDSLKEGAILNRLNINILANNADSGSGGIVGKGNSSGNVFAIYNDNYNYKYSLNDGTWKCKNLNNLINEKQPFIKCY
ncbi:MAG: hypothetical protein ACRC4L_00515, partial [Mycoplasma sp.]